ncbi:D-sedoheptulose 7-phosphate isomerase [Parasalinivibrio latis]|uniref:D-sedoheptulose-7-phosphate isomerase n=1 Tax=Parasalinivibrio latis TaxID=2952610 RepID=UPI0030E2ECD4
MDHLEYFRKNITASIEVKRALLDSEEIQEKIYAAAEICLHALREGNKIMIAGNGGSAADAQHIAGELVSRFEFNRPGLPAIALTTDTSILTAVGNDYGFEYLFARQLEALGNDGDVFIGISTSGNSPNILASMETAKTRGIRSIALGGDGGRMQTLADICISVPSSHTPRIQESHILIGHMLCGYVEERFFHG